MLVHAAAVGPRRRAMLRPQSIVTPPVVTGFIPGPTGTKVPANWPYPYNKAASVVVTSAAALQSAINAASPGDVIECNTNLTSGTNPNPLLITTPSGWSARSQAVLVRPPLGSRRTADYTLLKGHNLIFGGFDWGASTFGAWGVDGTSVSGYSVGLGLWRCVGTSPGSFLNFLGTKQGSLCEVVMPHRNYNGSGDRVDVYAYGDADQVDLTIDGCYIAGAIVGLDTVIAQVGEISGPTATTYSTTAASSGTINAVVIALRNIAVGASCTVTVTANGTQLFSGTVPDSLANCGDVADFRVITGLSQAITAGQSVTVAVSNIVGSIPNLTCYVGVRAVTHIDTLQFGVAGVGSSPTHISGSSRGALVRDSVFQGSGGETIQFNYLQGGDYRFIRNWLGTAFGSLSGAMNLAGFSTPDRVAQILATDPVRLHLVDNHFNSGPNLITGGTAPPFPSYLGTLLGNTMTNTNNWCVGADASNTKVASISVPPLPDLTTMWPECPIAVSN